MKSVKVTREGLLEQAQKAVNLARLNQLMDKLVDQLLDKNAKYKDAWQDFGIFTPLMRIREKLIRMESLQDGRVVLTYDPAIIAELGDIVGYGLLAMLWTSYNGDDFQQQAAALASQLSFDDLPRATKVAAVPAFTTNISNPIQSFPDKSGDGDYVDVVVRITPGDLSSVLSFLTKNRGIVEGYIEGVEDGVKTIHIFAKK